MDKCLLFFLWENSFFIFQGYQKIEGNTCFLTKWHRNWISFNVSRFIHYIKRSANYSKRKLRNLPKMKFFNVTHFDLLEFRWLRDWFRRSAISVDRLQYCWRKWRIFARRSVARLLWIFEYWIVIFIQKYVPTEIRIFKFFVKKILLKVGFFSKGAGKIIQFFKMLFMWTQNYSWTFNSC